MVRAATVGLTFRLTEFAVRNFNRIDSAMNRLERHASGAEKSTRKFNAALTATAAVSNIALGAAVAQAAGLEDAMARLETVTRSSTQSMETSLTNAEAAARSFSSEFTASTSEIIQAQFELATAGVAVEEQIAAVQGAFKLSEAAVGDFTETARLLGQLLNTFGKSARLNYLEPMEKVRRLTDATAETVRRFQVTLPVLQQGLKFVIGPAEQLGLAYEELTTSLGVLNTAGFRGTLGGTALSNMFNKLSRAIDKLDLDPTKFTDLEGNLTSIADFLGEVNKALAETTPLEGQIKLIETFDIRAGRMVKTLASNEDKIRRVTAEIELMTGATERMANIIQSTTSSEFKKMLNMFQNIATSIGKVVNVGLKMFLQLLNSGLKIVANFVERHRLLATVLAVASTLFLSLAAAVPLLTGAIAALAKMYVVLTTTAAAATVAVQGQAAAATASTAANATAATAIGVQTVAIGGITGAIIRFLTKIKTATAAAFAFILPLAIITAKVAVLIGGLILVGKWVSDFIAWFGGAASAVDRYDEAIKRLNKTATDTATKYSRLADELERLGKAARVKIKFPAPRGTEFGTSELAQMVSKRFAVTKMEFFKVVRSIEEEIGNEEDLINMFAKAIAGPGARRALLAMVKENISDALLQSEIFNPEAFKGRSFMENLSVILKDFSAAHDLAARSILGNNDDVISSFQEMEKTIDKIQQSFSKDFLKGSFAVGLGDSSDVTKSVDDIIESIKQKSKEFQGVDLLPDIGELRIDLMEKFVSSMDILSKSRAPEILRLVEMVMKEIGWTAETTRERIVELLDEGPWLGIELNIDDVFRTISMISNAIKEFGLSIQPVVTSLNDVDRSINRVRNSSNTLDRVFKGLKSGTTSFKDSQDTLTKHMDILNAEIKHQGDLYSLLVGAIANVENKASKLKEISIIDREFIEKAKELVEKLPQQIGDMKVAVDERELRLSILKSFEGITGFAIGSRMGKAIREAGSGIRSQLQQVFLGTFEGNFAAQFRNNLRSVFSGKIIESATDQMMKIISKRGADSMDQFVSAFTKAQQALGPEMKRLAEAGDFDKQATLLEATFKRLFEIWTGMSSAAEKSKGQFEDVAKLIDDITISSITATSSTAAGLRSLATLLSNQPKTAEDAQRQWTAIVKIMRNAKQLGDTVLESQSRQALELRAKQMRDIDKTSAFGLDERQLKLVKDATSFVALGNVLSKFKTVAKVVGDSLVKPVKLWIRGSQLAKEAAEKLAEASKKTNVAAGVSQEQGAVTAAQKLQDSANATLDKVTITADKLASSLREPFSDFLHGAEIMQSLSVEQGGRGAPKIELTTGDQTINIDISGGGGGTAIGGGFLDENEIKQIVEEAAKAMEDKNKEDLRALEQRLRDQGR